MPAKPVRIERVCGGQSLPEGFTDSEGRFTIELGANPSLAMMDASIPTDPDGDIGGGFIEDPFGGIGTTAGGLGRVNPLGCELRAELAGYSSDSIRLGRRQVFDHPEVGTIVLRRLGDVRGSAISITSLEAPPKARKAFQKALKESQKPRPKMEKVMRELQKAVALHPEYAAAWTFLGQLYMARQDLPAARRAYEKAAAADDKYLTPYDPLMRLALHQQRWQDANDLARRALDLNPRFSAARYCLAVSSYKLGDLSEAQQAALELQSSPRARRYPESLQLLGMTYAKQRQWQESAGYYRKYLAARPSSPLAAQIERELARWEKLGAISKGSVSKESGAKTPPGRPIQAVP